MKELSNLIKERISINEGKNELKINLDGNDIVKDIQKAIEEISFIYNQDLGVYYNEQEIKKQKQELINYINKFFEYDPEDYEMPIIGGTYEDNNGDIWKLEAYCSLDNKIKSSNVKNIKDLIRRFDTGVTQEYLDEYGSDLKKDTIFVGCHLNDDIHECAVFLWGDEFSNADLIKK